MKLGCIFLVIAIIFSIDANVFAKSKKKIITHTYTHNWPTPYLYGAAQLSNELNRIINVNNINAEVTVYVKSMRHGDALYTRNIYKPLTPASTLKVFTAEAALIFLGPEYRFATQLLTDAKSIKQGVLQGNLYVVLNGDPTLTYYDLINLVLLLRNYQITAVAGNVYIDNTAYDQRFYGPGWNGKDKTYCYAAPISASIINHNCLSFKMTSANTAGGAAQVLTSSKYFYPIINNSVVTKNSHTRACSLHLTNNLTSSINVGGCLPKGSYAGLSYVVTNVPEYNRALFKSLFMRIGISVAGSVTFGSATGSLSLIGQHASEPLKTMISELLKKSDNIIAGALFKKIGQLYTRTPGSWENGSLAVSKILSTRAQVDTTGLRILDGSGLSPFNLTSSAQMMQVLDFAFHHGPTSYDFIAALPIAGVDGTLKHRMGNIARKVRAKTGTISGVVSLAGYALGSSKEPLAFVIIINGNKQQIWQFRALEDQIVTALTRYVR